MLFDPRASDLDLDEVEAALLRTAVGDYAAEAAVLLLSNHGHWLAQLHEAGLIDLTVLEADPSSPVPGGADLVFAGIDWMRVDQAVAAGRIVGDAGQRRLLGAAESLAEGELVDLADLAGGIDRADLALLLAAIAHAGGSHERRRARGDGGGSDIGGPVPALVPWPERG